MILEILSGIFIGYLIRVLIEPSNDYRIGYKDGKYEAEFEIEQAFYDGVEAGRKEAKLKYSRRNE